jgi:glycosyltransferase involved in cell wall biosynthesis
MRQTLLVLASTYPRWQGDHEPGFVHELCRRLLDRFDVVVLTSHAHGAAAEEMMDGVRVVRYRYGPAAMETLVYGGGIASNLQRAKWKYLLVPGFLLAQYVRAHKLIRQERIDAIHAHWLIPQGLVAARLGKRHGIPFVVTSHGGDLYGLRGRLLNQWKRKVAAASAAMSVVSSAMKEEALALGIRPSQLAVLPMGVDLRRRFVPDETIVRHADELLFVGRLVPKKGLRHLLDALPMIVSRRPGVMLNIAGFGPDEGALRTQARELGMERHVTFLGAVPQKSLPELYRRASVLVAPFVRDDSGNQEGLPVVLMEAIGCGCPVVVGDVRGVDDLLGSHSEHLVVDVRNTTRLAEAVVDVLDRPASALARVRDIRLDAIGRIDWDNIARAYADLIASSMRETRVCRNSTEQSGHP